MFWMISSLNLLGARPHAKGAKFATFSHLQGFIATNDTALEGVIGFDLLLHLGLDLLEIFRRDAVRQFDVVIETVLDRRPGGELRFRPDFQNGGRQHMRARMADAFQFRHRFAFVRVRHASGGDIFGSYFFISVHEQREVQRVLRIGQAKPIRRLRRAATESGDDRTASSIPPRLHHRIARRLFRPRSVSSVRVGSRLDLGLGRLPRCGPHLRTRQPVT